MKETIRIQAGGKEAEQFSGAALGGAVEGGGNLHLDAPPRTT